jgi:hypothetical protein
MRVDPTTTNASGSSNIEFLYLNTSAGADISRNVQFFPTSSRDLTGNYAASANGGNALPTNYTFGRNNETIFVSAEL